MNLAIVYEAMAMMRVVLAFGTQRREYERFRNQGEKCGRRTVGLTVRQTAFKLAVQLITAARHRRRDRGRRLPGRQRADHRRRAARRPLLHQPIYLPLEELTNTIATFQQRFITC